MIEELARITTFGALPLDATFQLIWPVPGPIPNPPATTVFTKILPVMAPLGMANALYASDSPGYHNLTCILNNMPVRRVDAPALTMAVEAQPHRAIPAWFLPVNAALVLVILLALWR